MPDAGTIQWFLDDLLQDRSLLRLLLKDRTTGKNIIWASSDLQYQEIFLSGTTEMTVRAAQAGLGSFICPRSAKRRETQIERTNRKAEVFTPTWICNRQNNMIDESWFGRKDVFNRECRGGWLPVEGPVIFSRERSWQEYVEDIRLEVTCGEAPYLISRYDAVSGEYISVERRIGLLDRKFRVIKENLKNRSQWTRWAFKALRSVYGYEYQGDSLLLARINVLFSFVEYYFDYHHSIPEMKTVFRAAEIITWNLWQMDGLTNCVPLSETFCFDQEKENAPEQLSLLDFEEFADENDEEANCYCQQKDRQETNKRMPQYCLIADWSKTKNHRPETVEFRSLLQERK